MWDRQYGNDLVCLKSSAYEDNRNATTNTTKCFMVAAQLDETFQSWRGEVTLFQVEHMLLLRAVVLQNVLQPVWKFNSYNLA